MTIRELYKIIEDKKNNATDDDSYTHSLFTEGLDRIIQKVGEESIEVVIAAKNNDDQEFVGEVADLIYHLSVLLVAKSVAMDDIEQKLQNRHEDKVGLRSGSKQL